MMDNREIIGLLKRGWTDQMIKQHFIDGKKFNLSVDREVEAKNNPEELLNEIYGLGFVEVHVQENEEEFVTGYFKKITQWQLQKDEFQIDYTWIEHLKSDERDYEIELILPLGCKVRLWSSDESLSCQITRIIEAWPTIKKELEDLDIQINRLRNEQEKETEKICEWISTLLKGKDWKYSIHEIKGDMYLKVRIEHHRYLEIKLRLAETLPNPATLVKKLEKAARALDELGEVNLSVKSYSRETMWEKQTE